ncbi:MAG: carbohydrate ABC transporter permease [Spirochaetales bacterium]|nr:carbohydrate ABC transporter permease [Spirochaetales bacterium]
MKGEQDILVFKIFGTLFVVVIGLFCLLPFILILAGSLTEESAIYKYGYNLIPQDFSLDAYAIILKTPLSIIRAYGITITVVVIGTSLGLFITAMACYVLSQPDFKYRKIFSFVIYITSIFSGGLIPLYILMVRYLQLKDTIFALILPLFVTAWNIFLLRNFMNEVPYSIIESAKIDGAHEFGIFMKIVLPLSIPGLITIGLFQALYYWNDWMQAMLYINDKNLYPIQYYLYNMLNSFQSMNSSFLSSGILLPRIPTESIKMAMTVIATGPIVFLFSIAQKYFIKGLTAGSIKG